ncbi:unnamed protein product [Urochloa humidicola]
MGILSLARLTLAKRHCRRRRRTQADVSNALSEAKRKASPCRKGGNSGAAKRMKLQLTLDRLPQVHNIALTSRQSTLNILAMHSAWAASS